MLNSRGLIARISLLLGTVPVAMALTAAMAQANGVSVRPGPEILYAPPAVAPQLENTGIWHASPILVSGASAYRDGEFLYQGFLYDDHGAATSPLPTPPTTNLAALGTYTYPTGPGYAGNAANLIEFRMRPLGNATAIRLTYNTLLDPDLVATTIALGNSAVPYPIPHGANAEEPAQVFVTIHGSTADVVDAKTGTEMAIHIPVSVDTYRRQVQVLVPYSAFDPRGQTAVRVAAATGLWDVAGNRYLIPQSTADGTNPGGAGSLANPPAFFDVAFRYNEPLGGAWYPEANLGNVWREYQQAQVLATGNLSAFYATVSFVKLRDGTDDYSQVPRTGYIDRIYASHFEDAQGRGDAASLQPEDCAAGCVPEYAGQLQPYEIYVPPGPQREYGLTLDLHGAGVTYNEDLGTLRQLQFADRSSEPSIVLSPEGRGEAYWWYGEGLDDVFEAWADVARHYRIDPSLVAITGASMGGYGSLKIAAQWPGLFAAAAPHIPCPSAGVEYNGTNLPGGLDSFVYPMLPSLRNIPLSIWQGGSDPICGGPGPEGQASMIDELDALGYRYQERTYTGMGHVLLPTYADQAAYLGSLRVQQNPPHITYVLNGEMNEPDLGLNADHAYWISGLTLRNSGLNLPLGTIDVFSHGFGLQDPTPLPTQTGSGVLDCGGVCYSGPPGGIPGLNATMPVLPYISQSKAWGPANHTRPKDQLDITATNVSTMTIDVRRANVDCGVKLNVATDGPIEITLAGCQGPERNHAFG
jgi:hypothetical protein